jgi:hypothetical protein
VPPCSAPFYPAFGGRAHRIELRSRAAGFRMVQASNFASHTVAARTASNYADPFVERYSPTAVSRVLLRVLGVGVLLNKNRTPLPSSSRGHYRTSAFTTAECVGDWRSGVTLNRLFLLAHAFIVDVIILYQATYAEK